ncbi:ABC transporter ATP-binding protein [Devosia sp.]|uniref:ABC transporter ATP-binding protein n=1 Tax=Devosia sp. TaxID=1871048 RepID=UPI001AC90F4E|nr:ABC transporter ATP-binding protein [Devosia sp.]MBN9334460.1 ABC transporter ATP-binding protein [Devosia sp.]
MAVSFALDSLSVGYHGRPALSDISMSISAGVTCLLGPNGVGKTTLFKTMLGLLSPTSGAISLFDRPLPRWSRQEFARTVGYVPQAHTALFPYSALDVVLMGRAPHLAPYGAPSRLDEEIAHQSLEALGLSHLSARAYTELSGGERQLVLIARALAQEPRILVMDEPTASLDYGNQMRVLDRIRSLADAGLTVILSTHHPDHALRVADAVALISGGRLHAFGAPRAVLTPKNLHRLYGVDVVIGTLPGAVSSSIAPRAKESSDGA